MAQHDRDTCSLPPEVAPGEWVIRPSDSSQNRHGDPTFPPVGIGGTDGRTSRIARAGDEIVSAHVSHNAIAADQLPGLIQQVFNALATAEQTATTPPKAEPAVEVKRSIFADHIVCLDCGKHLSMLKRHLMTDHKLTAEQYRQRWELPLSYPLVAPNYAKTRSALAKKFGLGRKGQVAPKKAGRKIARKAPRQR